MPDEVIPELGSLITESGMEKMVWKQELRRVKEYGGRVAAELKKKGSLSEVAEAMRGLVRSEWNGVNEEEIQIEGVDNGDELATLRTAVRKCCEYMGYREHRMPRILFAEKVISRNGEEVEALHKIDEGQTEGTCLIAKTFNGNEVSGWSRINNLAHEVAHEIQMKSGEDMAQIESNVPDEVRGSHPLEQEAQRVGAVIAYEVTGSLDLAMNYKMRTLSHAVIYMIRNTATLPMDAIRNFFRPLLIDEYSRNVCHVQAGDGGLQTALEDGKLTELQLEDQ